MVFNCFTRAINSIGISSIDQSLIIDQSDTINKTRNVFLDCNNTNSGITYLYDLLISQNPTHSYVRKMEANNLADEEHKDDFKYIVRLMNTDLDGEQPTLYALRSIKGVGTRVAESIVRNSGVSPNKKIGLLDDSEIAKIQETFKEFINDVPTWMMNRKRDPYSGEDKHIFGTDLDLYKREDLNRLKKISCYRGVRHEQGQKVRGQRTRANGRTGMTMGVQRKKLQAQQKKKKEE